MNDGYEWAESYRLAAEIVSTVDRARENREDPVARVAEILRERDRA